MTPRVLIVEDNVDLAENMAELLEVLGAQVRTAPDRARAVLEAREGGFDLALVDLRLGGFEVGIELVPELLAIPGAGEVILVTGNATMDTAIRAVRQGVFAYVLKPFDPGELLAMAERALEQVSLRRERERLTEELARSEALYRGVVDTVPALILGIDEGARISFANHFAIETLGCDASELLGQPFVAACAAHRGAEALEAGLRLARQGRSATDLQTEAERRDGGKRLLRWTLMSSRALRAGILAVGTDVTARLELERRAAESQAMAVVGTLTAGLAHEIRNPINAAKLQLEVLSRTARKLDSGAPREKIEGRVQIVQGELSRLADMLNDFLSLARPRGNVAEPFEMQGVICEVADLLGPVAEQYGIRIEAKGDVSPIEIIGDCSKIRQVLINLVGNAIDAMRSQGGGLIELSAEATSSRLEVRVRDTGPGIEPAVAGEIFQPFVTTKEAGTGLGLTIVKSIIETHGGEISLGAHPEGGTLARFTLPR